MEESTIRVIPRKEFEHLITQHQEIALKVIKLLANNISLIGGILFLLVFILFTDRVLLRYFMLLTLLLLLLQSLLLSALQQALVFFGS